MVSPSSNVLPLYLAPSVDWFVEAMKSKDLILGDEQQFVRQTYRNRLEYGTFQGTKTFSIPLIQSTTSHGYKEVLISYDTHWPRQLVNAFRTAYGKSPFFEYYGYRFEAIILGKHNQLWALNVDLLNEIMNCLKIDTAFSIQQSKAIDSVINHQVVNYYQVFNETTEFQPHLTVLDLIYNEGPDAIHVLNKMTDAAKSERIN